MMSEERTTGNCYKKPTLFGLLFKGKPSRFTKRKLLMRKPQGKTFFLNIFIDSKPRSLWRENFTQRKTSMFVDKVLPSQTLIS